MPQIALFIDADNISAQYINRILETVKARGELISQFACGTEAALKGWKEAINAYHFKEITAPSGENAADFFIAMEVSAIAERQPEIEIFCIVSNDKHYIIIAKWLKIKGKAVIGIGTKASNILKKEYDDFIILRKTVTKSAPKAKPISLVPTENATPPTKATTPKKTVAMKPVHTLEQFIALLEKTFAKAKTDKGGGLSLPILGKTLRKVQADFEPILYGSATLSKLLKRVPDAVEIYGKSSVRLKPQADLTAKVEPLEAVTPAKKATPSTKVASTKTPTLPIEQTAPPSPQLESFLDLLKQAFEQAEKDKDGYISLATLGTTLVKLQPNFKPSLYGNAKLSTLLKKLPKQVEFRGKSDIRLLLQADASPKAIPTKKAVSPAKVAPAKKATTATKPVPEPAKVAPKKVITPSVPAQKEAKPAEAKKDPIPVKKVATLPTKAAPAKKATTATKPLSTPAKVAPKKKAIGEFVPLLKMAFAEAEPIQEGWVSIVILERTLYKIQPDFDTISYNATTLQGVLEQVPNYADLAFNNNGILCVRLRES